MTNVKPGQDERTGIGDRRFGTRESGERRAASGLDARRLFAEAMKLVYQTGGLDAAKNQFVSELVQLLDIPPDIARQVSQDARQQYSAAARSAFPAADFYARACALAWEDGEIDEPDELLLEALQSLLKMEPATARAALADVCSRPPPVRSADNRAQAPAESATGPENPGAAADSTQPADPLAPDGPPEFYRESGHYDAGSLLTLWMVALGAGLVTGMLYGPVTRLIAYDIVSIMFDVFMFCGVGYAVNFGARLCKVQNRKIVACVSFAGGATAVYFSFVSLIGAISSWNCVPFMPQKLMSILPVMAEKGIWSMHDRVVNGLELKLIWLAELLFVTFFAAFYGYQEAGSNIFCARCDNWLKNQKIYHLGLNQHPDRIANVLATGDLRVLATLPSVAKNTPANLKVRLDACSDCGKSHYLSVILRRMSGKVNGVPQWKETNLVDKMALSIDTHNLLAKRG